MKKKTQGAPAPNYVKWLWYAALTPFVLLAAMLTLTALGAFGRMPSFEELENPRSNIATEIYSEDGKVIGTFFVQNRSYVQYADLFPADSTLHIRLDGREVPPIVAALIATEDVRFRSHSGIDIPSLARVAVKTVLMQNTSQGGGSTITQQLAKNLFPRDTVRRQSALLRGQKGQIRAEADPDGGIGDDDPGEGIHTCPPRESSLRRLRRRVVGIGGQCVEAGA